jgi:S-adenosylmethionine:tRNA ribosyltransferase-isomerase
VKVSDFDYELPPELIAQTPIEPREASRMLAFNRATGEKSVGHFSDIVNYLRLGDVVVINTTRVMRARLFGVKSGGRRFEVFLHKKLKGNEYEVLLRPAKKLKEGEELTFGADLVGKLISKDAENGTAIMRFSADPEPFGEIPLPTYIKCQQPNDFAGRYQTVYSREDEKGSVAAPTAGLHWTKELMQKAKDRGVKFVEVVLNVGLGTFRPVKTELVCEHKMHAESYSVSAEAAAAINAAKQDGRRVICVGTTVVRTLESVWKKFGEMRAVDGETDIFIYPPYKFQVCDALVTNFHLPKSTLLMLVSAFIGRQAALDLYRLAIQNRFRFFSFGDVCFFY